MATTYRSPSAAVRARLNHPVLDSDGHTVEYVPAFLDYLRQVGGAKILERYNAAWAFNTKVNPFGARLKAMFSSDIGHWDVSDMREIVAEAYELVEKGLITEENFREFVFVNPVTLWTRMNPEFFKGTVIEKDAEKLLA